MMQSFSGPLWHVAVTAPRAELKARDNVIEGLGFDAYLPIERVRGKPGHEPVERPLMPRYLFVAVDHHRQDWRLLHDIKGVADILMTSDDVPGYVPTSAIEAMRKAEEVGCFDRTTPWSTAFSIGEQVRVSDGVFSGFNAIIEEFVAKMRSATASKRAKVLVDFMGRLTSTEIDLTALEKL